MSAVCRVFAPAYRQVTLAALIGGGGTEEDNDLAYADVLDAWRHYLAHENDGRGVLLIGHSQGAFHLRRLIAEEVEAESTQHDRIVAAYLIGGTVEVPVGEDIGGSFASTPICRNRDQFGCVLSYASYRVDNPPTEDSFFATAFTPGHEAVCNHPAALDGSAATVSGRYPTVVPGAFAGAAPGGATPWEDPGAHDSLETDFFSVPGAVRAECLRQGEHHFLGISMETGGDDPRLNTMLGELLPGWGLHLVDTFLTTNDMIALAREQATAWSAAR